MTSAIADPDEMRNFNSELRHFIDEEHELLYRLRQRARALGETWRDHQYVQLMDSFEQITKVMEKFLGDAKELLPYLDKEEELIREFLRQRL